MPTLLDLLGHASVVITFDRDEHLVPGNEEEGFDSTQPLTNTKSKGPVPTTP